MFKKVIIECLHMSRVPAITPHSKQQNERRGRGKNYAAALCYGQLQEALSDILLYSF